MKEEANTSFGLFKKEQIKPDSVLTLPFMGVLGGMSLSYLKGR